MISKVTYLAEKSLNLIRQEGITSFIQIAMKRCSRKRKTTWNIIRNDNSKKNRSIDIIIPVYDAYEDFKRCIESILSTDNNIDYNIIVVEDKSKDERIKSYLRYIESSVDNIRVISNSTNKGFIKSVNTAALRSKKDLIILNSDTVVTNHWLDEVFNCAYSNEKIATVTPLSNNATICSVPNPNIYNKIPKGLTIQDFADLVLKAGSDLAMDCIQLPTGIGFCLFVKRKVIDEIGLFDEIYGRGYNEENDFCMRAYENGYIHACCTKAFVYHKGKASFKDIQSILEEKNRKILIDRYPRYTELVEDFCEHNPLRNLQKRILERVLSHYDDYITIGIDGQLLKRNILTGTERYILALINFIQNTDKKEKYIVYSAQLPEKEIKLKDNFTRRHGTDSMSILLDSEKIDVFHKTFQCFTVEDLLLLLKARASVITMHDLILYNNNNYFDTEIDAKRYRMVMQLSAQLADKIIAISHHNKREIIDNLGVPKEKIEVIYHGIDEKFKPISNIKLLDGFKQKYKLSDGYILIIGTDFPHKNIKRAVIAYMRIISEMASPPQLVIVGPSTSRKRRRNLVELTKKVEEIRIMNYIDDEDIVLLYNCAKMLIFPSLYEGFGLPILEAMACGVPVVASNATSIPEVAGDAAILVDAKNEEELYEAMLVVLRDEKIRESLIRKGFDRAKEFNWNDTARRTVEVYKKALLSCENPEGKLNRERWRTIIDLIRESSHNHEELILDLLNKKNIEY